MCAENYFISRDDYNYLDEKLGIMVRATGGRCAILFDKGGYLILAKGDFPSIPPDDMGVMAAGAISALSNMADIAIPHITVYFHPPGTESVHFSVINSKLFLAIFHDKTGEFSPLLQDDTMKTIQSFIDELREVLGKREEKAPGFSSPDLINEKINEIFDKDI